MPNTLKNHKPDGRRTVILKPGVISFRDTRIECLVLNISTGGAGLVIAADIAIPFAFELEISDERIRRRCVLVWRNDDHLGVCFDAGLAEVRPSPEQEIHAG
jgi:PilZ domain